MIFVVCIIGWFVGDFVIGGLLYSVFGKSQTPNSSEQKYFGYAGKIIGCLLAALIYNSLR